MCAATHHPPACAGVSDAKVRQALWQAISILLVEVMQPTLSSFVIG